MAIPMSMGIHVGIIALPRSGMRGIAISLPATTSASTATTTTVPTILYTTLLHLPVIIPLSEFDSKLFGLPIWETH